MGKNPDYNPTVALDGDNRIPVGAVLEAAVGREHVVATDGDPDTASDAHPTSGRLAADTSTDPDTYYVGDGSSWNAVDANVALQGHMNLRDVNREALGGDKNLATGDATVQNLDPGGAARNVDLPAEEAGLVFVIANRADAAEAITVRDDADATVVTVNQNDVAYCISDGTGWIAFSTAGAVT